MSDSWKEMERAKEDEFFNRKNNEAMARLNEKKAGQARLSPITGEAMEHVSIHGIVVDRCPKSGYIGLDAGELEHILALATGSADQKGFFTKLFQGLTGKKA